MSRLCSTLLRLSHRDGEPDEERRRKEFVLPVALVACPIQVFDMTDQTPDNLYGVGVLLCIVAWIIVLAVGFGARRLPLRLCEVLIAGCGAGVLMIDWANAATPGNVR
eukprot:gene1412-8820_t